MNDDSTLSGRELEVLALLRTGASNAAIAEELYIGLETVKSHLSTIYRKLGVQRRGQAVAWLLDHPEILDGGDGLPMATVALTFVDGTARLDLQGEFDMTSVPRFVETLDGVLRRDPSVIEVVMSGVTFIDSGGVRALASLVQTTSDVTVRIVEPSRPARRVLEFAGLLSVFELVEPA